MKQVQVSILSLLILTQMVSSQDHQSLKSTRINDSTGSVQLQQLGIEVVYRIIDSTSFNPQLHFNNGNYWLHIGISGETEVGIAFVTRSPLVIYAESYKRRIASDAAADDEYPPQTGEDFDHRRSLLDRKAQGSYFDRYELTGGRWFGVKVYSSELIGGYATEATTYLDTVQVSLKTFSRATILGRKVSDFIFRELGLLYNNDTQELAMKLIYLKQAQYADSILRSLQLHKN